MEIIADLHIHGRFSRATSKDLTIPYLEKWARIKGINLLGTGDFTHPKWIEEIKAYLKDDGGGILKTANGFPFIMQTEVSLIYTANGRGRKIHNIILAPDIATASQITDYFKKKGRVDYDGRPIFKIPCPILVNDLRKINEKIEVIPAHIFTPWFSLFGSMSGFDSVKECFEDQSKYIHALETGLSSDPAMNWRMSQLDRFSLVSFSDLHSFWPWRIGREATVFNLKELSYDNLLNALRNKKISSTIEVDPAYGKYHADGHRNCNVWMAPAESIKQKEICPACKKRLTIGVWHRVEELADRPEGFKPKDAPPFESLIPLSEILSSLLGSAVSSKKIWEVYWKLVKGRTELDVLRKLSSEELNQITDEKIAATIIKFRNREIRITPGYDGVYGIPVIDGITKIKMKEPKMIAVPQDVQKGLTEF